MQQLMISNAEKYFCAVLSQNAQLFEITLWLIEKQEIWRTKIIFNVMLNIKNNVKPVFPHTSMNERETSTHD